MHVVPLVNRVLCWEVSGPGDCAQRRVHSVS